MGNKGKALYSVLVFFFAMFILTACKSTSDSTGLEVSDTATPTAAATIVPDKAKDEVTPTDGEKEGESTLSPTQKVEERDTASDASKDEEAVPVIYDKNSALKDVFSDYFLMGAAINGSSVTTAAINHDGMAEILKTHFNSTTLSNLMKPSYLLDEQASKSSSDGMPVCKFDSADPSLQFAMENGIKMRGHVLVWHNQTPEWFFYEDFDTSKNLVDAATMELRLESYIKQVIEYCQENYPGVVYCWDVVNEAINENGSWRATDSYWYTIMKETYIEKAFYYARKYADEGIGLFYNEYNVFNPSKRLAIYMMAHNLKEKGLIDGLGLQPTVGLNTPELDSDATTSSFKKTLELFAQLGLEIQITELSFNIDGDESNRTPENLQKQADRYYEMMYLLLKEDTDNGGPCNITSVTVFGICDDYPLYDNHKQNLYLWDKDGNPKASFYSYLQAGLDWQAASSGQ